LIAAPGDEVYDDPMRSALGALATDFTHCERSRVEGERKRH
jgi:hypothetical protein